MATRKQAVLLIHGIGEQKPMDTLRGFVEAVWTQDSAVHHPFVPATVWSKPDLVSDSFELRRLTTPRNKAGIRTDFYEFYWAHLIQDTTLSHVWAWARLLLLRAPWSIPSRLTAAWFILFSTLLVCGALILNGTQDARVADLPRWASLLASVALFPLAALTLRRIVGDAARYLHAAPTNIRERHAIRAAGLQLLHELHARGYERIIVVGHSLGSVIGYDLLTYAWARTHEQHASPPRPSRAALDALERLLDEEEEAPSADFVRQYRTAQERYLAELRANGSPWRVTDFVTLGSPLTHAALLLARSPDDLGRRQQDRELPTCPPEREKFGRQGLRRLWFRLPYAASTLDGRSRTRVLRAPHHAAGFAVTRWTNLYFGSHLIVWGDLIGGPLRAVFGAGIRDLEVRTSARLGFLSHTSYWRRDARAPEDAVTQLRKALDLLDQDKGAP